MKGTRKLLISVIALVVTLAMAVTSTYAWFTTNPYVTVEGFNVNVKTQEDEGLFIKLDEIDMEYSTGLTAEQIANAIKANNTGSLPSLDPLTSMDGTTLMSSNKVITPDDPAIEAGDLVAATPGQYAKFTLMFRSTKAGVIILLSKIDASTGLSTILSNESGTTQGGTFTAWDFNTADGTVGITRDELLSHPSSYQLTPPAELTASGDPVNIRAANAARVTFDSQTAGDQTVVWGPNAYKDAIQTSYYQNVYGWTVSLPADYKGVGTITNDVILGEQTGTTVDNAATSTIICTLTQNGSFYEASVVVYVWLDGNDGSCINTIAGDSFTIDMQFRRINAPEG